MRIRALEVKRLSHSPFDFQMLPTTHYCEKKSPHLSNQGEVIVIS